MPAVSAPADPTHDACVETFQEHLHATTGLMFGVACLKIGKKAFAGSYDSGVVFELAGPTRTEALQLGRVALFDPTGGRPMRWKWVVVPATHADRWRISPQPPRRA